jgi:hypothetical protein
MNSVAILGHLTVGFLSTVSVLKRSPSPASSAVLLQRRSFPITPAVAAHILIEGGIMHSKFTFHAIALTLLASSIGCGESSSIAGMKAFNTKESVVILGTQLRGETYGPHGELVHPPINSATSRSDTTFFQDTTGAGDPYTIIVNYTDFTFKSCPACGTPYDGGRIFVRAQFDGQDLAVGHLEANYARNGEMTSNEIPEDAALQYSAFVGFTYCHFLQWVVSQADGTTLNVPDLVLTRPANANDRIVRGTFQCSH